MTDVMSADDLRDRVSQLLDEAGVHVNRSLIARMVHSSITMGQDQTERLDLKIASAALSEMREAFRLFAPLHGVPKVTIFGSARTKQDDTLYRHAHDVARQLSSQGWMVVTGAGPGIMEAGAEGAGSNMSIGVSIRLPFEEKANAVVAADSHLVSMKYFFTRKLMLVKESRGFVCLPGGFGTMDEMFELLTLQQTGKAEPMPIVLLDEVGGSYWTALDEYVRTHLAGRGYIAEEDMDRVLITDSVEAAVEEILTFWSNYDSLRWVGDRLVLRMHHEPTDAEIEDLNERFGDLVLTGRIERTEPLAPERNDNDRLDLPRIALTLNQFRVGALHRLVRALNELPSARGTAR